MNVTRFGLVGVAILLGCLVAPGLRAQTAAPRPAAPPSTPEAVLTRYCVTCHNDRLKTAGFVIDPAQLSTAGDHAEAWEKVVKKSGLKIE